MTLLILFIFASSMIVLVTSLYIIFMNKRHSEIKEKELQLMGIPSNDESESLLSYQIPECIAKIVKTLIQRKKSYISNYITFQISNKIFGVSSVVFALLSFLSQTFLKESNKYSNWLDPTISFFSIIFVIVALYISPTSRVSQYIEAWKKSDERMNICIAKCCLYKSWKEAIETARENNLPCDDTYQLINQEAEEIAQVLTECERVLCTDSE